MINSNFNFYYYSLDDLRRKLISYVPKQRSNFSLVYDNERGEYVIVCHSNREWYAFRHSSSYIPCYGSVNRLLNDLNRQLQFDL